MNDKTSSGPNGWSKRSDGLANKMGSRERRPEPDLIRVIDGWPHLCDARKAGIPAMMKAALPT